MEKAFTEIFIKNYSLEIPVSAGYETMVEELESLISDLIQNDFTKLVNLLYRVDVDEKKLKQILQKTEEDAAVVITGLIIERELEKYRSRNFYRDKNQPNDEEKW
jgi:hypothetical protein